MFYIKQLRINIFKISYITCCFNLGTCIKLNIVSDGEPKTGYIEHVLSIWVFCDKSFKHSMKIEVNF